MSEIIRAYELKRGDIFKKLGTYYLVIRVSEKEIVYSGWSENYETHSGAYGAMGGKTQERVEYMGVKPKKKLTKPFNEDYLI